MPFSDPMNWDGFGKRWRKTYKGVKYEVYCHQLGLSEGLYTRDGSRASMRAWWDRKLSEIHAARTALHPHPHEDVLRHLGERLDYAKRHGLGGEVEALTSEAVRVSALPAADFRNENADTRPAEFDTATAAKIDLAVAQGVVFPPDMDPTTLRVLFSSADLVHVDRVRREQQAPPDRTVGALADRWLADRQHEARAGVRSNENADALRRAVYKFRDFIGPSSPVESITADAWGRWYVECAGMVAKQYADPTVGWSADTAAKYFGVARSFVTGLWERDILAALPKNLNAKKYKFERPDRAPPTFTNDDIAKLLGAARNVHRLILLLMLNCGMTQKDVADLKREQIDTDGGRITRRRSKTGRMKSSRLVSYKMWPEVAALLKKHMAPEGDRALVTKSGKAWVWTEMTDTGKFRKSDNVATVFNTLKRSVGMTGADKSLKIFRKTSATRLKSNKEFRDLRFWFLGHSERTIADRHYAANSQQSLDDAVAWLGTEYGLV